MLEPPGFRFISTSTPPISTLTGATSAARTLGPRATLRRTVLVLSNGHGEDVVGAHIARALKREWDLRWTVDEERQAASGGSAAGEEHFLSHGRPELVIKAFPVVGEGGFYRECGLEVVAPTRTMPSGGFLYQSPRYILKDLASGLLTLTLRQIRALRALRAHIDIVLGVGDNVPLFFNALVVRKPMVFVGVARSARYKSRNPYSGLECRIMRRYCRKVIVRDPETCDALVRDGVQAIYLGNPMMDSIGGIAGGSTASHAAEESRDPMKSPDILGSGFTVAILPGSREDAYAHMRFLAPIVRDFAARHEERVTFAVALASTIDFDRMASVVEETLGEAPDVPGARGGRPGQERGRKPEADMSAPDSHAGRRQQSFRVYSLPHGSKLVLASGAFGEVLSASSVVIGLSGTGNEQAAGMGKPIITFATGGHQMTPKFVRGQKALLGGALSVVDARPEAILAELEALYLDGERREAMGLCGIQRMEGRGACEKIARAILEVLEAEYLSLDPFSQGQTREERS